METLNEATRAAMKKNHPLAVFEAVTNANVPGYSIEINFKSIFAKAIVGKAIGGNPIYSNQVYGNEAQVKQAIKAVFDKFDSLMGRGGVRQVVSSLSDAQINQLSTLFSTYSPRGVRGVSPSANVSKPSPVSAPKSSGYESLAKKIINKYGGNKKASSLMSLKQVDYVNDSGIKMYVVRVTLDKDFAEFLRKLGLYDFKGNIFDWKDGSTNQFDYDADKFHVGKSLSSENICPQNLTVGEYINNILSDKSLRDYIRERLYHSRGYTYAREIHASSKKGANKVPLELSNNIGTYEVVKYESRFSTQVNIYCKIEFRGKFGEEFARTTGIGNPIVSDMSDTVEHANAYLRSIYKELESLFGSNPSQSSAIRKLESSYTQEVLSELFLDWSHGGR